MDTSPIFACIGWLKSYYAVYMLATKAAVNESSTTKIDNPLRAGVPVDIRDEVIAITCVFRLMCFCIVLLDIYNDYYHIL